MCQERPSADPVRQGRYPFATGTLALLVIACAVLLALYRGFGYEAAVLVGLLAAARQVTRRWRRAPRLVFLTVAAFGAYFAAYHLSLYGKVYIRNGVDAASGVNRHSIDPMYCRSHARTDSFLGPSPDTFFRPALWVDRHVVRREYWATVENRLTRQTWRNP
jgi:hypothetical protein